MSEPITKETLSLELKVGVALLAGPCTLTELAERMGMDKRQVSRALDVLFDQGQVDDEWAKREGGHFKEVFLSPIAVPFFQHIKDRLERTA